MNLNKEQLTKQCWNCKYLKMKSRNIKTKKWRIKCLDDEIFHEIESINFTPKGCPYYLERTMLELYDKE